MRAGVLEKRFLKELEQSRRELSLEIERHHPGVTTRFGFQAALVRVFLLSPDASVMLLNGLLQHAAAAFPMFRSATTIAARGAVS